MLKFLSCSFRSERGFGFLVRSHMALTGISIRKPSNNKRILYVNRGQTMTLTKNLIGMQSHHYSSLDQPLILTSFSYLFFMQSTAAKAKYANLRLCSPSTAQITMIVEF